MPWWQYHRGEDQYTQITSSCCFELKNKVQNNNNDCSFQTIDFLIYDNQHPMRKKNRKKVVEYRPCIQETNSHLSKSLSCIQCWWKMKWRLCSSTLDNMRINVPCRKTKTEKKAFSLARSHCNVRYAHNNSNSNIVDRRENEIHASARGNFLVIYLFI